MQGGVILVVDDEPAVLRLAESLLKAARYCVYASPGADDAIRTASLLGAELDVLLCDVFLPDSSGLEVIQAIRPVCPNARMILMSGEFTDQNCDDPFRIGKDQYLVLPKPFSLSQLLSVIDRALNQGNDSKN